MEPGIRMATLVRFPKVGADVMEGTVALWHRRPGDAVRRGDALVEIVTSKAAFDVESPADGILREILAPEKSLLPVGYALAIIGERDEELPDVAEENTRLLSEFRVQALRNGPGGEEADLPEKPKRIRATPAARRAAKTLGVDLADIAPTAGRSVITEEDVTNYGAE